MHARATPVHECMACAPSAALPPSAATRFLALAPSPSGVAPLPLRSTARRASRSASSAAACGTRVLQVSFDAEMQLLLVPAVSQRRMHASSAAAASSRLLQLWWRARQQQSIGPCSAQATLLVPQALGYGTGEQTAAPRASVAPTHRRPRGPHMRAAAPPAAGPGTAVTGQERHCGCEEAPGADCACPGSPLRSVLVRFVRAGWRRLRCPVSTSLQCECAASQS